MVDCRRTARLPAANAAIAAATCGRPSRKPRHWMSERSCNVRHLQQPTQDGAGSAVHSCVANAMRCMSSCSAF